MAIAKGVKGRMILDHGNFFHSSCARQAPRVRELFEAGCSIRLLKPRAGGFACSHFKTVVYDGRAVFTGSVNLTHNGFENNEEQLFIIRDPATIEETLQDFEERWEESSVVDQAKIDEMMAIYDAKNEAKRSRAEEKGRSKSSSSSRSVSASRAPSRSKGSDA